MGDIMKFTPPAGTPTFVGKGSKLEHPDILPVFWGPYWPGGGAVNTGAIMQAIRSVCSGPYLNGLKQYGRLDDQRPDSVVHTCATQLLEHGASIEEVQDWLGHRDIRNTLIYAKIIDRKRMELAELAKRLNEKRRPKAGQQKGALGLPATRPRTGASRFA